MSQIQIARIDPDRAFLFEEDVPDARAARAVGIRNPAGQLDFDHVLSTIQDAAGIMAKQLIALPSSPSGVEITFGVKLSSEVGAIVAKAGGEANFTIKLSWSREKS